MQIDLKPHEHSTHIEVVKTPKKLFFILLAIWVALALSMVFVLGQHWVVLFFGVFSAIVGAGWVGAYPEYHMRKLKD